MDCDVLTIVNFGVFSDRLPKWNDLKDDENFMMPVVVLSRTVSVLTGSMMLRLGSGQKRSSSSGHRSIDEASRDCLYAEWATKRLSPEQDLKTNLVVTKVAANRVSHGTCGAPSGFMEGMACARAQVNSPTVTKPSIHVRVHEFDWSAFFWLRRARVRTTEALKLWYL